MNLALHALSDLIHALVADTLHGSAEKLKKITEAVNIETKKLKAVKSNLEKLQNFVGQAEEVVNGVARFLPYL
jgi:ABC-type transporter Mla subunit MlaD